MKKKVNAFALIATIVEDKHVLFWVFFLFAHLLWILISQASSAHAKHKMQPKQ